MCESRIFAFYLLLHEDLKVVILASISFLAVVGVTKFQAVGDKDFLLHKKMIACIL